MAASYQPHLGFDTLGFAQTLIAKGDKREAAETLSVIIRDHVVNGLATNDFVDKTVQDAKVELKNEIIMTENRTL